MESEQLLECRLCYRADFKNLVPHINRIHFVTGAEYRKRFQLKAGSLHCSSLRLNNSRILKRKFQEDSSYKKDRLASVKKAYTAHIEWQKEHPEEVRKIAIRASRKGKKARSEYWTEENRKRKGEWNKQRPKAAAWLAAQKKNMSLFTERQQEKARKTALLIASLDRHCKECGRLIVHRYRDSITRYLQRINCSQACQFSYMKRMKMNFKQLKEHRLLTSN